jgi:hypothetical protein
VTQHEAAYRARDKADRERGQREQRRDNGVMRREEKLRDREREKAIDSEIVKLEQVADDRSNHDLALRYRYSRLGCND